MFHQPHQSNQADGILNGVFQFSVHLAEVLSLFSGIVTLTMGNVMSVNKNQSIQSFEEDLLQDYFMLSKPFPITHFT